MGSVLSLRRLFRPNNVVNPSAVTSPNGLMSLASLPDEA